MNDRRKLLLALLLTALPFAPSMAEPAHEHEGGHNNEAGHEESRSDAHEHEEAGNRVHLDAAHQRATGIRVEALVPRPLPEVVEAPGEIRLNAYATSLVTPRIAAQIVARHARLGERVETGQPLITLSSVEMAEAQGSLLVAAREWQRVRKLGKKVVSARRYLESRVAYQQARARLLAYGMSEKRLARWIRNGKASLADGRFELLSPQDGTVIRDDFVVGQLAEPGQILFEITDESRLWVEARVEPREIKSIRVGAPARILADGDWRSARVIQIHHALDENTRTLAVRLELANPGDRLHPGQFVSVAIDTDSAGAPVLSVPLGAVLRAPDGDWRLFVEAEPGEFAPREVKIVRQVGGRVVIDGIEPGTRVVVEGAFFVQSELAKAGFEVHNH